MFINELTIALYGWDLADHGPGTVLDTVQETAGCNAAYIIALMHDEKRPLWDTYYPKNPVRKYYRPEDSRIQWLPDASCYKDSRIKPLPYEEDFIAGKDWIDIHSKACRERGMKPGVEISHTPLDKVRAQGEFVDCVQRDIWGNPLHQDLCWNNEHSLAYMSALMTDVVKNHDVEMLQTCSRLFAFGNRNLHPFLGVTVGGCFCDACEKKARSKGLDWDKIKSTVRYFATVLTSSRATDVKHFEDLLLIQRGDTTPVAWMLEYPELFEWLKFRTDSIVDYFRTVSAAIHAAKPDIDFRWNTWYDQPEYNAEALRHIAPHVDSVRIMEYTEQLGDPNLMYRKSNRVSNVRRMLGDDKPLNSAVAVRAKATPEIIHDGLLRAVKNGADMISLAFWDGCTMEQLAAVKSGMERHEIKLRT